VDTLHALSLSPPAGAGWAVLAGLGGLVVYAAQCLVWPFGNCRRCRGQGRHMAWWERKHWRDCRRCLGTGKRRRVGWRVFSWWLRRWREGGK
jgi:hypothetical protein